MKQQQVRCPRRDAVCTVARQFPNTKERPVAATSVPTAKTEPPAIPGPSPRRLIALAAGLLGLCCAGAAISLSQHLPGGATHAIDGRQAWHDFISGGGTAMSPPLPVMILFAVAIAASPSRRWIGTLGAVAVAIGGIAFTLGIAIEPITLRVLTAHPDALKTPLTVLALVAAPATALAAALHLRQRLEARRRRSGALR
jgi:hypothetical protein